MTGATDGIGRGVAGRLAEAGARVLLHGRDEDKLGEVAESIARDAGVERPETWRADLANLDEVRRLAEAISERHDSLDVLVNNAGLGSGGRGAETRELSLDGHELRFQVNHLAPFLLTRLLLPRLEAAGGGARIVNVASAAQTPIDLDDPMMEHGYSGRRAYAQSKLAMVMASFSLAERLDPASVAVNALHPGSLLDTKMVREAYGRAQGPVETGIESETFLAISPELDGVSGAYYDRTRPARAESQAYDDTARERLWSLSERLTGLA